MKLTEQDLVIKAKAGDYRAFEELVYAYDRRVLATVYRFTGDPDDAKDLYQDIFIRAFKGLKKFEFKSSFSTWLYRIAVNVCLTHKAKAGKRNYESLDDPYPDSEDSKTEQYEDKSGSLSPEKSLLGSETRAVVRKAVDSLSPRLKMVFVMKHYDGLKIKEIAEMLETKEGTVKKYLFEAVHILRGRLAGYLEN